MSRSLHTFLPEVSPSEAVEYVLPLLIGLACDDGKLIWCKEIAYLLHRPPIISQRTPSKRP